jgi:hypothetical protein
VSCFGSPIVVLLSETLAADRTCLAIDPRSS